MCTGFWFCLRSAEYLAVDGEEFDPDRSLTWSDITPYRRLAEGTLEKLPLSRTLEADEISIVVYSGKNDRETCTRTLPKVEDSDVCVVMAIQKTLLSHIQHFGKYPDGKDSLFVDDEGKALSRDDISKVLKLAAEAIHIPEALVASHSLRRGGASSYVAAGGAGIEEAVARFGRWKSMAWRAYVYSHSNELQGAIKRATCVVPRFERN